MLIFLHDTPWLTSKKKAIANNPLLCHEPDNEEESGHELEEEEENIEDAEEDLMLAIATVYKWFWNFVVHFIVTEMTSLYNINTMTIELHNPPTFSA